MKIAIIGGGYTGLSAAYYLSKKNHQVFLFEKEKTLGGLVSTFKEKKWQWPLEKYYHHIFTTDQNLIKLAEEVGCPISFSKPKTSIFLSSTISGFGSPVDLLQFPSLPLIAKLRTGVMILGLKLVSNWQSLEKIPAIKLIQKLTGKQAWKKIWLPLFQAKFDDDLDQIPASWFWARIKKRGDTFGYPQGGFQRLTESIIEGVKKEEGLFFTSMAVEKILIRKNKVSLKTSRGTHSGFDKIICTVPGEILVSILPDLPQNYIQKLTKLKWKGVLVLILSLKKKFLNDKTYWLNINQEGFPFVGVIEQTNFVSKSKYNQENLIYLVNYLPSKEPLFKASKGKLIKKFLPYLQTINPRFNQKMIKKAWVFKSDFAQPIMTLNYSKRIPSLKTPVKNVYLANAQQVYPWDRQVNYAIKLGKEISEAVCRVS